MDGRLRIVEEAEGGNEEEGEKWREEEECLARGGGTEEVG